MNVPIPGMAEVDDRNLVLLLYLLDSPNNIGHAAAGDYDILVVLGGIHITQRRGNEPPHLPQLLRFRIVLGYLALHKPQRLHQFLNPRRLALDELSVAVHLDEQHGPRRLRQPEVKAPVNALQGRMVHEFQGSRDNLVADDRRYRLGSAVDGIEDGEHRLLRLRQRKQLEDYLGDDPECPFAAAEQSGEVVPDHPLVGLAAGADDLSRRQHHLQPHHEISGDPVFYATRTTSIFGDVATKGGELERGRIGRIKESQLFHFLL